MDIKSEMTKRECTNIQSCAGPVPKVLGNLLKKNFKFQVQYCLYLSFSVGESWVHCFSVCHIILFYCILLYFYVFIYLFI